MQASSADLSSAYALPGNLAGARLAIPSSMILTERGGPYRRFHRTLGGSRLGPDSTVSAATMGTCTCHRTDPDPMRKPDDNNDFFQAGDFTDFIRAIIRTLEYYHQQQQRIPVM